MRKYFLLLVLCTTFSSIHAQTASRSFNKTTMQYKGGKEKQLKLLFRKVLLWGEINETEAQVDSGFIELMQSDLKINKKQLKEYLRLQQIDEDDVGGNVDNPVSFVLGKKKVYARYFVIHDTSFPVYKDSFPDTINADSWEYNDTRRWHRKVTHVYVTRTGHSRTVADFNEKHIGTKFEKRDGKALRGLYLHIELVQPRVYPPGNHISAPIAPAPGFPDEQYARLALLYICASVRTGEWLIPAFHAVIDEGIKNAYDDPQGFERRKFTDEVLRLVGEVGGDVNL